MSERGQAPARDGSRRVTSDSAGEDCNCRRRVGGGRGGEGAMHLWRRGLVAAAVAVALQCAGHCDCGSCPASGTALTPSTLAHSRYRLCLNGTALRSHLPPLVATFSPLHPQQPQQQSACELEASCEFRVALRAASSSCLEAAACSLSLTIAQLTDGSTLILVPTCAAVGAPARRTK